MMMKAVCFVKPLELELRTVPRPFIEDDTDVVVKVIVGSICGSDLHPYRGHEVGIKQGTVMGHEMCGKVEQVGSKVTNFQIGDIVVCPFTTCCGHCHFCKKGLSCRCIHGQLFGWIDEETGHGLHGTQAEYVRVPMADSTMLKLPPGVSPEKGLLLGDILATGFYCAQRADITKDSSIIVVVGLGPVGLLAVACASYLASSTATIIAVDCVKERLAVAKQVGATKTVNFKTDDVVKIVHEHSDNFGADCVLELVGQPAAMRLAYECLAPGGVLSSVGVHAYKENQITPEDAYNKNITLRSGRCPVRQVLRDHLGDLIATLDSHNVAESIITHKVAIDDVVELYKKFNVQADGIIKGVITFQ